MPLTIDERIAKNAIRPDEESHIVIEQERCKSCDTKPCLRVCPGHLYSVVEETGLLHVEHAGCLECGTCMVICPQEALTWRYPTGGAGIRFRFG